MGRRNIADGKCVWCKGDRIDLLELACRADQLFAKVGLCWRCILSNSALYHQQADEEDIYFFVIQKYI